MKDRLRVPSSARVRLNPARRFYIRRLLATGLYGNSPGDAVERIFCTGLQQVVPLDWTRDFVPTNRTRRR
jgi:hypothetical protein